MKKLASSLLLKYFFTWCSHRGLLLLHELGREAQSQLRPAAETAPDHNTCKSDQYRSPAVGHSPLTCQSTCVAFASMLTQRLHISQCPLARQTHALKNFAAVSDGPRPPFRHSRAYLLIQSSARRGEGFGNRAKVITRLTVLLYILRANNPCTAPLAFGSKLS